MLRDKVQNYQKLKMDLQEVTRKYKTAAEEIKELMEKVEYEIFNQMEDLGVDRLSVGETTIYRTYKDWIQVKDWNEFLTWAKDNDALHVLTKRPAKQAVMEIMNESGAMPPGLSYERQQVIQMRRS